MLDIYSDAKVILVVEKEASFQRLMNDGLLEKLKPCIVITVIPLNNDLFQKSKNSLVASKPVDILF